MRGNAAQLESGSLSLDFVGQVTIPHIFKVCFSFPWNVSCSLRLLKTIYMVSIWKILFKTISLFTHFHAELPFYFSR